MKKGIIAAASMIICTLANAGMIDWISDEAEVNKRYNENIVEQSSKFQNEIRNCDEYWSNIKHMMRNTYGGVLDTTSEVCSLTSCESYSHTRNDKEEFRQLFREATEIVTYYSNPITAALNSNCPKE
jgi:hypothetical protein